MSQKDDVEKSIEEFLIQVKNIKEFPLIKKHKLLIKEIEKIEIFGFFINKWMKWISSSQDAMNAIEYEYVGHTLSI